MSFYKFKNFATNGLSEKYKNIEGKSLINLKYLQVGPC